MEKKYFCKDCHVEAIFQEEKVERGWGSIRTNHLYKCPKCNKIQDITISDVEELWFKKMSREEKGDYFFQGGS